MKTRYRDLTEKYRAFRLQPDSVYFSRVIQTLFNKFTKQGKKALAKRHITAALTEFRYILHRPRTFNFLTRTLRALRIQFLLVQKRQAKQQIEVPVPVRRNKRDVLNIQTLYNAVSKRRERKLSERLGQELTVLNFFPEQSATLRQRNVHLAKVYEERVHMEKR